MCLLTGVVRVLNWLGTRKQKMKEKMVASPLWLATAPAATYCLFELLGCCKHIQCSLSFRCFSARTLGKFWSLLNFNGEGTDLGLHQEGPVGVTLSIGIWSYN